MKNQDEDIMLLSTGDDNTGGSDTGTGDNNSGNTGGSTPPVPTPSPEPGGPIEPEPGWGVGGLSLDNPETNN